MPSVHFAVELKQLASTQTFCNCEAPRWLSSFQQILSPVSCAARNTYAHIYLNVPHKYKCKTEMPHDLKRHEK